MKKNYQMKRAVKICLTIQTEHIPANNLLEEEIKNPLPIIKEFYLKFDITYLRHELLDFVDAAVCYRGFFEDKIDPLGAVNLYAHLLCLVEAGYINQKNTKVDS